MPIVSYLLSPGAAALYPPVDVLSPNPPTSVFPLDVKGPFTSLNDVIRHYTLSSLACEGFTTLSRISVEGADRPGAPITIALEVGEAEIDLAHAHARAHVAFLQQGEKALRGVEQMQATPGAWNPMAGFRVNFNNHDGLCKWSLCLPLGMAMITQAAVTLMHYPPYVAMQNADYLHNNTLARWQNLLECCGLTDHIGKYTTIVDVNPIAAPGSGQSEYPNDYFPIMMSSVFFDNEKGGTDYLSSMLAFLLNQGRGGAQRSTLPLLVCGSPLYDPQATGWFRVAYKDQMPQVFPKHDPFPGMPGIPTADVLQAGLVHLKGSPRPTPYMIANHMIAAGVTGKNTGENPANAATLPDIRQYEGQDLTAAEFLRQLSTGATDDPAVARKAACLRWFGNEQGTGAPVPPADADKALLCAMALVDLYFNRQKVLPWYTLPEARALVAAAVAQHGAAAYNPCNLTIYPDPVPRS